MNIALLTFDFSPDVGGVQRYLYEIVHHLAQHHSVSVLTPVEGPAAEGEVHRFVLPRQRPLTWIKVLRARPPDRVLVGHAHPRLLLTAYLTMPDRFVVIAHGNDFLAAQTHWHRPLFNALLKRAAHVITNSQSLSLIHI